MSVLTGDGLWTVDQLRWTIGQRVAAIWTLGHNTR
jgi:hypothetical protein